MDHDQLMERQIELERSMQTTGRDACPPSQPLGRDQKQNRDEA